MTITNWTAALALVAVAAAFRGEVGYEPPVSAHIRTGRRAEPQITRNQGQARIVS